MGLMELLYDFDIVGGPFDGAPGMKWLDDGDHPCPESIFVGVCRKGEHCGSSTCRPSVRHVTFWTPDESRPHGCASYSKQHEHVIRGEEDELSGKAVYAIGGLLNPQAFAGAAREPVTA